jgi:hypothetical protein
MQASLAFMGLVSALSRRSSFFSSCWLAVELSDRQIQRSLTRGLTGREYSKGGRCVPRSP